MNPTNQVLLLGGAVGLLYIASRAKASSEPARAPRDDEPERERERSSEPEKIPTTKGTVPPIPLDPGQNSRAIELAHKLAADIAQNGAKYDQKLCADFQTAAGMTGSAVDGVYGKKTRAALLYYVDDAPAVPAKASAAAANGRALQLQQEAQQVTAEIDAKGEYEARNIRMLRAKRAAQLAQQQQQNRGDLPNLGVSEVPPIPLQEQGDTSDASSTSSTPRDISAPTPINLELARREAPTLAQHLRKRGKAGYSRQLVTDFQKHAGIKPDGVYGPYTRSALIHFGVSDPPAPFIKLKPGAVSDDYAEPSTLTTTEV